MRLCSPLASGSSLEPSPVRRSWPPLSASPHSAPQVPRAPTAAASTMPVSPRVGTTDRSSIQYKTNAPRSPPCLGALSAACLCALPCKHGWVSGTVQGQHRPSGRRSGRTPLGRCGGHAAAGGPRRSHPPFYRWFPDGELNTCANALDRHVADGRGDVPALIYDSPVTGTQRTYSYAELLDATARFAGVLRRSGGRQGRPRRHLHADDPRGGDRDARVRTARRGALGGVRRVRGPRTCGANRRRQAGCGRVGFVRNRAHRGSSSTSRCWTPRSRPARNPPRTCVIVQRDTTPLRTGAGARPRLG